MAPTGGNEEILPADVSFSEMRLQDPSRDPPPSSSDSGEEVVFRGRIKPAFYVSCKISELRRFIKAKTRGSEPELSGNKEELISQLRQLDREASFRFQALPPELRIEIYRILLVKHHQVDKKLWPNIMATSKKIYAESEDVVYHDEPLWIVHRVNSQEFPRGRSRGKAYEIESQLGTHSWHLHDLPNRQMIFEAYRAWLPAMAKFKRISLKFFDHEGQPLGHGLKRPETEIRKVFEHIYAMASLLALAKANVELVTFEMSEAALRIKPSFCWPIGTLPGVTMAFSGIKDEIVLQLKEQWTSYAPLALVQWFKAEAEAETLLRLIREAQLEIPGVVYIIQHIQFVKRPEIIFSRGMEQVGSDDLLADAAHTLAYYTGKWAMLAARAQALAKLKKDGQAVPLDVSPLDLTWKYQGEDDAALGLDLLREHSARYLGSYGADWA